jgi:signal peptidase I
MKASYLIITFLAALFLLKFTPLPFGVYFTVGISMEPTMHAGDIVIVWGREYDVGDIIVWSNSPLSCIVHRVVGVTSSQVITKGDNNPVTDFPVSKDSVRGKVVAHVPREYWMPTATVLAGAYVYRNRRKFRVQFSSFDKTVSAVLVANVLVACTMIVMSPVTAPHASRAAVPSISLYGAASDPRTGDIIVKYFPEGLDVKNVTGCTISSSVGRIACIYDVENGTVYVHVPREYYAEMNVRGEGFLTLVLNATLTRDAVLYGKYLVHPTFAPLSVKKEGYVVHIVNPNFFPVKANVGIYYAQSSGAWNINSTELNLMPGGEASFNLSSTKFSYIEVKHVFFGKTVAERVQVTYDGRP